MLRDRERLDVLESAVPQLIDLLKEILNSLPTAMVNALEPLGTAVDNLQTDLTNVGRIQQAILSQLESLLIFQQTIQAEIDAIRDTLRTAQATIGNLDNSADIVRYCKTAPTQSFKFLTQSIAMMFQEPSTNR